MEIKIEKTTSLALQEFVEFITSSPSLETIANYHLSDEADAHIDHLLDANRNGTLTPEERAELNEFAYLNHVIIMTKLTAIGKLRKAGLILPH